MEWMGIMLALTPLRVPRSLVELVGGEGTTSKCRGSAGFRREVNRHHYFCSGVQIRKYPATIPVRRLSAIAFVCAAKACELRLSAIASIRDHCLQDGNIDGSIGITNSGDGGIANRDGSITNP